ncbi:class I SAM-dependent methyltransferase [Luminiphilus sp.]|nr:class I SAM-dependent methyltransferase [Luminiphilus sp.]
MERLQMRAPVIIEAGSNTGSFLLHCQRKGANVIGIEPSKALADRANFEGLRTLHGYFNAETSTAAVSVVGRADCFYVANTLANVDDLQEFLSAASNCLQPNGILLVDTQDGEAVIDHLLIDTIYHEHLSYFTEHSLSRLAEQYGLFLEQTIRHPSKGGAMLCVFSKSSAKAKAVTEPENFLCRLSSFTENVHGIKKKVGYRLQDDSSILAFGSSVGCSMLASFFSLDERVIAVLDDNPQIDAILTNRGPIQVVPTSEVVTYTADTIILLAHRYEATIRKSLSIAGLKDPAVIFNPWKH